MENKGWTEKYLYEFAAICIVISPTVFFFEYGSIAFMYAIMGRLVRKKSTSTRFYPFVVTAYAAFILLQVVSFEFDVWQWSYVVIGTALVVAWLSQCPIKTLWPDWRTSITGKAITVLSRNTLPYYFYHRFLFQTIAAFLTGALGQFVVQWFR